MAKVFIGVGHGGSDSGAVSYLKEKDVNLNMALACRDYLVSNGVQVKMSRTKDENDTLTEEIIECNQYAPDLAVDIHNNAGGGDGFEAFYTVGGGKGKTLAQNIESEIKKIGQNSRGIKTKANSSGTDYFGFIRETRCPAVITEGVFVDNKADAQQADTLEEQKTFGIAIAKGILNTLGIKPTSNTTKPTETKKDESVLEWQKVMNKTYHCGLAEDNSYGPDSRAKALEHYLSYNPGKVIVNDHVRFIQQSLKEKGYNLQVDGSFGPDTRQKVLNFQKANKLVQDGFVGADTTALLLK